MAKDPNKKNNLDLSNDYDDDEKVINGQYPVREGQEDSSIRFNPAPNEEIENEGDKQSIEGSQEAEEFIGMYNNQSQKKDEE